MAVLLLVDDNEGDHFYNKLILEGEIENLEILNALDGEEALNIVQKADPLPTLVLLDINMPVMSGFDFLEKFNEEPHNIPVVVMLTSSDQEQDKQKAGEFDMVKDFFVKPLNNENVDRIKSILAELNP